MAYKIENGNIVSKDTSGSTRKFIKANVDVVIGECKKRGITNKYLIAGILGTISKESGFVPQNENLNYSADGLLKIFPSKFGAGKASAQEYAKKPEKIANYVYGGKYGNSAPEDGYKFRGRGFNQITFKDLYKKYGANIPGILENPDQLNNVSQAAIATIAYYVEGFKSKQIKKNYGKSAYDMSDWNEALLLVVNVTAGIGFSPSASNVRYNYDKAKKCHGFLIDYLEQNPEGTNLPPDNPSNVDNAAQAQQDTQNSNENQQSDSGGGSNDNGQTNSGPPVKNLTQFFKPTIKPTEITFNADGVSKNDRKKISEQAGYQPFIWYNGVQISYQDIQNFNLYHRGILPTLEVTISDSWGILREDGFPHDDTLVTIYLNSKSMNLRSIHMDFKILDFKDNGNNVYTLTGICNIPEIYLRRFKSLNSKTSHEALQEVAKSCGLGFCANINNSDDKMTWINPGFKNLEFIENIVTNSYISDTSFQYCYVDYYYNLCYVDLGKELERDVSQDKMVIGFGYKFLNGQDDEESKSDEETTTMLLSNDKSMKESTAYFSHFDIINKSTKISIDKAFRTRTKYYDSVKKELLIFDIESQTSDGSKSIILKGGLNDDKYFQDNTTNIYVGKLDMFEDGKGNVHKNYNYSLSQNRQNLDDITKISCILTLPSVNYNLYVYQKIPIYYSPQKQSPTIQNEFYKRISGEWLITEIEFHCESGKTSQIVKAIKRELSLLPEEAKDAKTRKTNDSQNVNNENNVNELAPSDTPAPEPTPSQPVTNNQPAPPTQVTAEDQSYYQLDYIIGSENFKDNSGKVRNLVLVDGQPVDELVAVAYLKMKEAAKKEGINLSISSGFRPAYGPNLKAKTKKGKTVSITTQESIRRDKSRWSKTARSQFTTDDDFVFKAKSSAFNPQTAAPGKSNHGNGIALDLNTSSRISFSRKLKEDIYIWLVKNGWKFGFVRAVKTEEWHFEYRPDKSKNGPYAVISGTNGNLFYSDLGLDNIKIA